MMAWSQDSSSDVSSTAATFSIVWWKLQKKVSRLWWSKFKWSPHKNFGSVEEGASLSLPSEKLRCTWIRSGQFRALNCANFLYLFWTYKYFDFYFIHECIHMSQRRGRRAHTAANSASLVCKCNSPLEKYLPSKACRESNPFQWVLWIKTHWSSGTILCSLIPTSCGGHHHGQLDPTSCGGCCPVQSVPTTSLRCCSSVQ